MSVCPDCGAKDTGNGTCRQVFESFLALEFTDPAYGEVHLYTVATFMIQHYQYTQDALEWICRNMRSSLKGERSIQNIRDDAARVENAGTRILRSPEDPRMPRVTWKMTIADVAQQYDGAAGYCSHIRLWAESTLQQLGY